jgi:hypothetical protein
MVSANQKTTEENKQTSPGLTWNIGTSWQEWCKAHAKSLQIIMYIEYVIRYHAEEGKKVPKYRSFARHGTIFNTSQWQLYVPPESTTNNSVFCSQKYTHGFHVFVGINSEFPKEH